MNVSIGYCFIAHVMKMPAFEIIVDFIFFDRQLKTSAQLAETRQIVVLKRYSEPFNFKNS